MRVSFLLRKSNIWLLTGDLLFPICDNLVLIHYRGQRNHKYRHTTKINRKTIFEFWEKQLNQSHFLTIVLGHTQVGVVGNSTCSSPYWGFCQMHTGAVCFPWTDAEKALLSTEKIKCVNRLSPYSGKCVYYPTLSV